MFIIIDIHNPHAKHIVKQAGLTPEERLSFQKLLDQGLVDSFRYFYPAAKGQFTYWSKRTNARPVNKGLRLDYFLCTENLFDENSKMKIEDSYILHDDTVGCSDHCPVILILAL
jgi:exodeoxyribonuclease III